MHSEIHGRELKHVTTNGNIGWIANYIWGIANDVLRDLYVRGQVPRRHPPDDRAAPAGPRSWEDSKQAVLDMKASLDAAGVVEQDPALRQAADQAFYNTSKFTLRDLRARASRQQLTADFIAYLDGFSPNVQDILDNFEFRNQISRLSKADALGTLIERLTSPDINLSPEPVMTTDGSVRTRRPRQPRHGNHLRGAGAALQRREQRRGRRALDTARRRSPHVQAAVPAHRGPNQVGEPTYCTTAPAAPEAC